MAWFLFIDESGHDHRQMPFEVRGGLAIADDRLWGLLREANQLELDCFGTHLVEFKSEIKGDHLLSRDRFKWAAQGEWMEDEVRRQNCRAFLQAGLEKKAPRRSHFTAYGQACLAMVDGIFELLRRHQVKLFAAMVPRGEGKLPAGAAPPPDILRKDHIFLLERFFYFLEREKESGILVMGEMEEQADRRFVRRLQSYFTGTVKGRQRAQWIVPSPFFVSSSMALSVQMADVVIYALNWGYRRPVEGSAECREEIAERYGRQMGELEWRGTGYDGARTYRSYGIVCVPDLYETRR